MVAVEVDPALAAALPATIAAYARTRPTASRWCTPTRCGSTRVPGPPPTALVANLPYNVSVPVLLHLLALLPSLEHGLVMVQSEVADRLAAPPGSKVYGIPSVKAAWFADVRRAGAVGRNVFWPAPNVDSGLVAWTRREPPTTAVTRQQVFAVVDAAFAHRRKALRPALRELAGSAEAAEDALRRAGIDPMTRGEQLRVRQFVRIAEEIRRMIARMSVTVRAPAKINLHLGVGLPARTATTRCSPSTRRSACTTTSRSATPSVVGRRRARSATWTLGVPPRRGQHRRPRRPAAGRAPRPRACGRDRDRQGDPGRRRPGRRQRGRRRGAGGARPAVGPADHRRGPARARRAARQRRAVRADRRHRARHRARRAGRAGRGPRHLLVGGGAHATGSRPPRSTATSTSSTRTLPHEHRRVPDGLVAALPTRDAGALGRGAAQRPRGGRARACDRSSARLIATWSRRRRATRRCSPAPARRSSAWSPTQERAHRGPRGAARRRATRGARRHRARSPAPTSWSTL